MEYDMYSNSEDASDHLLKGCRKVSLVIAPALGFNHMTVWNHFSFFKVNGLCFPIKATTDWSDTAGPQMILLMIRQTTCEYVLNEYHLFSYLWIRSGESIRRFLDSLFSWGMRTLKWHTNLFKKWFVECKINIS